MSARLFKYKNRCAGSFSIDVEEGTYDVTVSAAGYAAQTVAGVEINSNKSLEAVSLVEKRLLYIRIIFRRTVSRRQ